MSLDGSEHGLPEEEARDRAGEPVPQRARVRRSFQTSLDRRIPLWACTHGDLPGEGEERTGRIRDPVPEPSTLLLLVVGCVRVRWPRLATAARVRTRRRRAPPEAFSPAQPQASDAGTFCDGFLHPVERRAVARLSRSSSRSTSTARLVRLSQQRPANVAQPRQLGPKPWRAWSWSPLGHGRR